MKTGGLRKTIDKFYPTEEVCELVHSLCARGILGSSEKHDRFYVFIEKNKPACSTITTLMQHTFGDVKCRDFKKSTDDQIRTATFVYADLNDITKRQIERLHVFLRKIDRVSNPVIFLFARTFPHPIITSSYKNRFTVILES